MEPDHRRPDRRPDRCPRDGGAEPHSRGGSPAGTTQPAAEALTASAQNAGAGASLIGATPAPVAPPLTPTPGDGGADASRSTGGPAWDFPVAARPLAWAISPVPPPCRRPPVAAPSVAVRAGPAPTLSSAAAAERVADGHLPPLPTQEPPRPDIAPGPPPPLVPVTATPPVAAPPNAGGAPVDFDAGSATLNDAALTEVREFAAIRATEDRHHRLWRRRQLRRSGPIPGGRSGPGPGAGSGDRSRGARRAVRAIAAERRISGSRRCAASATIVFVQTLKGPR